MKQSSRANRAEIRLLAGIFAVIALILGASLLAAGKAGALAGEPNLGLAKTADRAEADPGDKGVNYTLTITNTGNAAATEVIVTDNLPTGLVFADGGGRTKTWRVGTVAPGVPKQIVYAVDIAADATAGTYTNTAVISADNHFPVSASASLQVGETEAVTEKVTEEALAETGFSWPELPLIIMFAGALAGVSSLLLKRKEVKVEVKK